MGKKKIYSSVSNDDNDDDDDDYNENHDDDDDGIENDDDDEQITKLPNARLKENCKTKRPASWAAYKAETIPNKRINTQHHPEQ